LQCHPSGASGDERVLFYGGCIEKEECTLAGGSIDQSTLACMKPTVVMIVTSKPLTATQHSALTTLNQRGFTPTVVVAGAAATHDAATREAATVYINMETAARQAEWLTLSQFAAEVPEQARTSVTSTPTSTPTSTDSSTTCIGTVLVF
jgi:hypothetical protein